MINSIARSNNPAVTVNHTSTVFQPEGGVYNFVENATDGDSATIGGVSLSGSVKSDGSRGYAALSGATSGLRVYSSGSAQSATIYYGQSFLSKLTKKGYKTFNHHWSENYDFTKDHDARLKQIVLSLLQAVKSSNYRLIKPICEHNLNTLKNNAQETIQTILKGLTK